MDPAKKQRLEANGWKVSTVADFLQLKPEESLEIEIKLALDSYLREQQQAVKPELKPSIFRPQDAERRAGIPTPERGNEDNL